MIYTCRTFPADLLTAYAVLPRKVGKRVGKNRRKYINVVAAFDIETTRINKDLSVMYIWQLQIGFDCTIIGRNWHEYQIAMQRLLSSLPDDIYLVCYVHNLAFEFQFLRGIYDFKEAEVFAVESRRPLRADMYGHLELRCSYLHSNMRLETFLAKMGVPTQKLTMDYDKKRYPWTPLTTDELAYCIADVKGLVEAVTKEMLHDGDDLYTIPATSTGYVRRDVKAAMRLLRYGEIKNMLPDLETYTLLREAFRGGNTHANRYFAKQVLEGVLSEDRSSAYPDVMVNDLFPYGPFRAVREELRTWEKLYDLKNRRGKALLIRLRLEGVKLRNELNGCPYISRDKCRHIKGERVDNGRILSADSLELTITDIDLDIIGRQYIWEDSQIMVLEHARYSRLPEVLRKVIIRYYKLKTELKGVDGMELLYEKSKNKLNSIYGMSATNPVKRETLFRGGAWDIDGRPIELLLEESNRKAFFPYQWGVWVTARARQRLQDGIDLVESQGGEFVYCDTDSVKYIGDVDWSEYNNVRREASKASGAYADDRKGIRHYMGEYEPDSGYPARFATRGAKKYVVEHDGKLTATIAGVGKREDAGHVSGGMELMGKGGIEAFLEDTVVFEKSGGVELRYNDKYRGMMRIDGHRIKVRECVTISPRVYTLTDTDDYSETVLTARALREYLFDVYGR